MPRKAAAPADATFAEPRRSSRIKDQPKVELPTKKALAKPRAKKTKASAEPAEGDAAAPTNGDEKEDAAVEKPKSTKGKKRTASEKDAEEAKADANGAEAKTEEEGVKPPSKRVRQLLRSTRCVQMK